MAMLIGCAPRILRPEDAGRACTGEDYCPALWDAAARGTDEDMGRRTRMRSNLDSYQATVHQCYKRVCK